MFVSDSVDSPGLVGRQQELDALDRALNAAQKGYGQCVLIAGEAGIGKSRMTAEISTHAAERYTILRGYCAEQDSSYPYAPWIDALRAFFASKSPAETNELLGPFTPEMVKLLPELSPLTATGSAPLLDPAAEKHRLFENLTRFFASMSGSHPLLIILEDLHWSDEQSLELLQYFARRIATLPILTLGTYRNEAIPPRLEDHLAALNRTHLVDEIQLMPLARSEVGQMVQAILKTDQPLSPDWLDLLMPLTEGNPFFVEEITKSIIQAGSQPGQWDPFQIPRSIKHSVQRRVDALHDRTRQVLSIAAVIGERFDFKLLQEITGEADQSLVEMLRELIAAQLVIEKSSDQFAFHHALTREVVYASVMLRERKAIHQVIADTLENLAVPPAKSPLALLEYHYYQAEGWQKAMGYAQRAGDLALALYAPREALTHFKHAIEAARNLGIPIPLLSLLGHAQAQSILGEFDNARADYEHIIELARTAKNRDVEWQALVDLGYAWQPRDLERAGEYYQQALQLARSMDDASVLALTLNRYATWHFYRSQPHDALPLHREALEIFQMLGDHRGISETLALMGMASYGIGDIIQGVAYYEQAIPLLREVDNRQGLVRALEFLSLRARLDTEVLGEVVISDLARYGEDAFEVAHSFDWREGEGEALSRTAICWSKAGEYDRALELLQRAQRIGEELDHRHLLTSVHLLLGELFLDLLALDQAREHLEHSFSIAQEVGAMQLLKSVLPLLVDVCSQQNDLPRARAVLAVLPLDERSAEIEQAGSFDRLWWSAQAELELTQGRPKVALEIVDRLIGSAQNIARYGPHAIPWLSRLRAHALVALEHPEQSATELEGAKTITAARCASPLLWRLHADLGHVYRSLGRHRDARQMFSAARTIIQDLARHVPDSPLHDLFIKRALATMPAEHVPTQRQSAKSEYGGLTTREREIAALIAHGKSNHEIASELFISDKTAERHVANILSKLGFNARTQIAAWAVGKGLDK